MTKIAAFIVGLCVCTVALAQQDRLVSFDYSDTELALVINDLENRYDLHFTYSSSQLPLGLGLTAKVIDKNLDAAVEDLFQNTPIKYAFISDQIALRADRGMLAQLEMKETQPVQKSPIYTEDRYRPNILATHRIAIWQNTEMLQSKQADANRLNREQLARMTKMAEQNERNLAREEYKATHRLAQISLLPYLGTNSHRSKEVTNKISFNIFWGASRAINGFEMGGIANSVVEEMHGFQIAGVLNQVGGKMTGTQIAGLINHVGGTVNGLQWAIAGGNVCLDSVKGVQIGLLFNVAQFNVEGVQLAGLFNWAEGDVRRQNAILFNRANRVEKRQLGLFNFCDTTAKAPYGLLSFVKKGYNKFEISGSEEMFVQIGGKFGTHKLYNILQFGLRWDHIERQLDGITTNGNFTSWSLGYGFGIANRLGKKGVLSTEITASHVNELENWTKKLNLWGQFKLSFDYQSSKHLHFFAGPTFNIMWSKLYDAFDDRYGSRIPPRSMWSDQRGSTNIQSWIGFTAGLRI